MNFEFLLARRYIFSQKRHSILTICSIVLAVAMMTMIFTCYATFNGIRRDAVYDTSPYHVRFYSVDQKQSDTLKNLKQTESYNITKNDDGTYQFDLMLKKGSIGDFGLFWREELSPALGIDWMELNGVTQVNRSLMNLDRIDDAARFNTLQLFCILFVFVIFIALALRLIIDTAFEISSKEHERQFGILQSVGATPKQVVNIITAEGALLSIVGLPVGVLAGIGIAYAAYKSILSSGIAEVYFEKAKIQQLVNFHIDPLLLLVSAVVGFAWVLFSAYGTGMRVIKMSPIEAISNRSNKVKKIRRHTLIGLIFGWVGKLASRNARRQPKRFIITILSLTLSITLFAVVGSFFDSLGEFAKLATDTGADFYADILYPAYELDGFAEPLKTLENSELFSEARYTVSKMAYNDSDSERIIVYYMNRDAYNNWFGNEPPVPYDELKGTENYILAGSLNVPDMVSTYTATIPSYTIPEEYISELKKIEYDPGQPDEDGYIHDDDNPHTFFNIITEVKSRYSEDEWQKRYEHTFSIAGVGKYHTPDVGMSTVYRPEDDYEDYLLLIATTDQYLAGESSLYGNISAHSDIELSLAGDDCYDRAKNLINNMGCINIYYDNFEVAREARTTIAAVGIGSRFLTGFIILIAIVNMINIISTGIINRRSELASMQCVGMTGGQLYKMAIVEAIQYTLISLIGAVILCVIMAYLMGTFLTLTELIEPGNEMSVVNVGAMIRRITEFSVMALAVSILSELIPLQRMQRTSLVEQIRSVD